MLSYATPSCSWQGSGMVGGTGPSEHFLAHAPGVNDYLIIRFIIYLAFTSFLNFFKTLQVFMASHHLRVEKQTRIRHCLQLRVTAFVCVCDTECSFPKFFDTAVTEYCVENSEFLCD
eukprot:g2547.t1